MRILRNKFYNSIYENPVIASINDFAQIGEVIESSCEVTFCLQEIY